MTEDELEHWLSWHCHYCKNGYMSHPYDENSNFFCFTLDGVVSRICSSCCVDKSFKTPLTIKKEKEALEKSLIPEEDKIFITTGDYDKFKFCTRNWLCKLIYKVFGND